MKKKPKTYYVAGDEHHKRGFIPVATDCKGRFRVVFSSPFEKGLTNVSATRDGDEADYIHLIDFAVDGFTVQAYKGEGLVADFAIFDLTYLAMGWGEEAEARCRGFAAQAAASGRPTFLGQGLVPDAAGASKIDNIGEENTGMENGGAGSALTREGFEKIKKIRDDWRRQRLAKEIYMSSVDTLIAEVERLHPDWALKRYEVVRIVDRHSRTECFAEFGPDCIVREMQQ